MGIRTNELLSNGHTARVDDQDEIAKKNRLRQFFDNIKEIWSSIPSNKLEVDANREKVFVVNDVLQQLEYRGFL